MRQMNDSYQNLLRLSRLPETMENVCRTKYMITSSKYDPD